jgi:hypothetical protein
MNVQSNKSKKLEKVKIITLIIVCTILSLSKSIGISSLIKQYKDHVIGISTDYYTEGFYPGNKDGLTTEVVDYDTYVSMLKSKAGKGTEAHYTDKSSNYLIITDAVTAGACSIELHGYEEKSNKIVIRIRDHKGGSVVGGSGDFIAVPTEMPVGTKVVAKDCDLCNLIESMIE